MDLVKETDGKLAILEYVLVVHFRPTFLFISNPNDEGDVQIIISSLNFRNKNISERVTEIFNVINNKCPDIIQNRLLIIQAYNSEEMENVLEEVFEK